MRAVRLIRDQTAPMERRARADPSRNRGRSSDNERSAHAIALRANLLRLVDLRLRVEEATYAAASFSAAPGALMDPISGPSFARSA